MMANIRRIIALAIVFAAAGTFSLSIYAQPRSAAPASKATATPVAPASAQENPFTPGTPEPSTARTGLPTEYEDISFLSILWRLTMALILSAALAFRPRKNVPLFRRSLFVSQTQILLAVVAAALMLVVGDNTARAFAIFAAASLVRFRTNIRDPKEITVLLISLALGLAAGVGRWELGVVLCLFALALLWLLEYNESNKIFRSMELTVKTRNTDLTQELVRNIFRKYKVDAEVREIQPSDEESGQAGSVVYYTTLHLGLSTDKLSDLIMRRDEANVEGIQWSQKKGGSDLYQ